MSGSVMAFDARRLAHATDSGRPAVYHRVVESVWPWIQLSGSQKIGMAGWTCELSCCILSSISFGFSATQTICLLHNIGLRIVLQECDNIKRRDLDSDDSVSRLHVLYYKHGIRSQGGSYGE